MARDPAMRDVELVESEEHLAPAPSASRPGATGSGGRVRPTDPATRRRRAVRGALAVTLLVLVAAGTGLGADRRERARLAALADVPGLVAPVEGPVDVRWRLPGSALTLPRWVDDRVVTVDRAPDGGVDVLGLDPATGDERWRTPVSPPGQGSESSASCESPAAADAPRAGTTPGPRVLACLVVHDTDTADAVVVGTATYPTRARLVVLEASTGRVRRDEPVPATTSVAVLGPDLLLAHVDDAGHVRVARVDPVDGTERWVFRSPDAVPADALGRRRAQVTTDGDLVVLDARAAWALTPDGRVRRAWPPGEDSLGQPAVVQLLAGRGAVARVQPHRSGSATSEVVDVGSGRAFAVPGYPAALSADDGSMPELLVVDRMSGPGRAVHDLRTGRELWTSASAPGGVEALVAGRLLGADAHALRARDARTGDVLWTVPLAGPGFGSIVTDGRVVLLASNSASGEGRLSAHGLGDGRERWAVPVPPDLFVQGVDGAIVGYTRSGVVVLTGRSRP